MWHDELELWNLNFALWFLGLTACSSGGALGHHLDFLLYLVDLLDIDFWLDEAYVFDIGLLELLDKGLLAQSF